MKTAEQLDAFDRFFSGVREYIRDPFLAHPHNRAERLRSPEYIIGRAYDYAERMHAGQSRDGGEPYFNHCRRVALRVVRYGDFVAVATALLHDVVEDCDPAEGEIHDLFGLTIEGGVIALSRTTPSYDPETGVARVEKRMVRVGGVEDYFNNIRNQPGWIRLIKVAARIDNLSDMDTWTGERLRRYCEETEKYIVPLARGLTDPTLYGELQNKLVAARSRLPVPL